MNARNPAWCKAHGDQRRGTQLLKLADELKDIAVKAPDKPSFEYVKCKATGEIRSRTVDLVVSRAQTQNVHRIETYAALASDHYPISFEVKMKIDRERKKRRITKTLLQSHKLRVTEIVYYGAALNEVNKDLEAIESKVDTIPIDTVHEAY